jgi:hypothetical protein
VATPVLRIKPRPNTANIPKKRHSHYARRERPLPDLVEATRDYGDHVYDNSGRLRLVPVRDFSPQVPFRLDEGPRLDVPVLAPVDQLGPVLSQQVPVVTGNDFESLMAAFNKRCNYYSDERVCPSIVKEARKLASLVFPKMEPYDWTEDIYTRWISKFSSEKQSRMASALSRLHDVDFRTLNTKSLMVKGEVLLKRNDPSWAPRIIYVGSDEYNVLTGPLMDEFNKRLYCALDEFSDDFVENVIFAYTKSDVEVANALGGGERYVEGDFSSNDKSQKSDVHEIFAHWLKCSGAPSWFVKFYVHNSKRFKVVSYEYGVSAEIENQLATGGTDTTGRNTVWNLCQWWSYVKKKRYRKTRVAILGDDLAGSVPEKFDLESWESHCAAAGMKLKAKHRNFYCDLTFLSRFFVPLGTENCMVPLIGKALMRFNARANRNTAVSDEVYMCGKALSYAYEFRHVAYMRDAFLQRARSTGVSFDDVDVSELTWFAKQNVSGIDDVLAKITNESIVLSDDQFLEVIMAKYDIGLYDMDELRDRLILDTAVVTFEDQRYYAFEHEVA